MKSAALMTLLIAAGCGAAGPGISSALPAAATEGMSAPASVAIASPCKNAGSHVADPTAPHGLMVWIDSLDETKSDPGILRYLPSDPNLCGASIVVLWSAIDKGPGAAKQYDFSPIEAAARPWHKAGKLVNLLFAGVNEVGPNDTATPPWVLDQTGAGAVDTVACPNPGSGNAGPPTPVYWEHGYSAPWRAFISAAIAHYAHDPRIGYMRFGLGAGAEDFPQHGADGACFSEWQKYNLSATFWAQFSGGLVRYIASQRARYGASVQQLVALNAFSDPSAPYDVASDVAGVASRNGIGFGTENLGSGNYGSIVEPCSKNQPPPYWCRAFDTHAGTVPLEFQPINFTLQPGVKIAPLPELLPYALYNHAQVFELYPQEWLTADDPSFSTYAKHHIAWKAALTKAASQLR